MATLKLKWKIEDDEHDLCLRYRGLYLDVIHSYDGKWRALFNNRITVGYYDTRELAALALEQYLIDFRKK